MKPHWTILLIFALILGSCTKNNEQAIGYIVQVSSGTWHQANYSTEQIISRLEMVTSCIKVDKVIIGWNLNKDMYRQIGAFLHDKDIQMFFWLPVFAETQEMCHNTPAVDIWGQAPKVEIAYCEGFQFDCPTHPNHIRNILAIYDNELADCPFDGVFLDRIRTQSFVAGVSGVLNCGCEVCTAKYREHGVLLDDVRQAIQERQDAFFNVSGYSPQQGFLFNDSLAARFFRVKGKIISESVAQLADSFHQRNMQVGMDLYAPLLAQFVGQNYGVLAAHADFIKPMLYRKTYAPAGIGYEYDLLLKSIPQAEGYPKWEMNTTFLKGQLQALSALTCQKYPGLEINYYPHTAPTSPEYILESIQIMEESGCTGVVLSWDIMQAPDEHIQIFQKKH